MIYIEKTQDLFSVNTKEYALAHCISSDCKMGAGIAKPMNKKMKLGALEKLPESDREYPACIYHNGVYNLITKEKYSHVPLYPSLRVALVIMRNHAIENDITKIAMPKIGSGLDKLNWGMVRAIIQELFEDTDLELLVCRQ